VWLYSLWKNAEFISLPVRLCFIYSIINLLYGFLNAFRNGILMLTSSFLKIILPDMLILVSWLILMIGKDIKDKVVFVVLRGLYLLINIPMTIKSLSYQIEMSINHASSNEAFLSGINILYMVLHYVCFVLLFIYILKPELFRKKNYSPAI
jgi:hypothetical protein